ncbi:regulator of chromosome condensation (RCC1) repeat protein [Peptococcaceae bacterium CEB3]|nr:regulator of chromosome condensation (RCC1) repeat protein [Peptococcaceae bacterium CEB3]
MIHLPSQTGGKKIAKEEICGRGTTDKETHVRENASVRESVGRRTGGKETVVKETAAKETGEKKTASRETGKKKTGEREAAGRASASRTVASGKIPGKKLYWLFGLAGIGVVLVMFMLIRGHGVMGAPVKKQQPAVAAGGVTAYYLSSSGHVWAWGGGEHGQLGNGSVKKVQAVPVRVANLSGITEIAAGESTGYALDSSGQVWAWGDGLDGELGNGRLTERQTTPVRVANLAHVVALAAGEATGYALDESGHVWAWGDGENGELGNGTTGAHLGKDTSGGDVNGAAVPVRVVNLPHIVAITASGVNGYALDSSGGVWAWGDGRNCELGNGSTGSPIGVDSRKNVNFGATTPVRVLNLTRASRIFTGGLGTACALTSSGQLWAWGNADGSLFNGSRTDPSAVPVPVLSPADVREAVGGTFTSYALDKEGRVWACGDGTSGQLGNGAAGLNVGSSNPVRVLNLAHVIAIAGGNSTGYALDSLGQVWAWGDGKNGELGNGTTGICIGKGYYGDIFGADHPVRVQHLP